MNDFVQLSVAASVCTVLGALPALLFKHVSHRGKDILLAYAAGIMVAASTYGLIPSALRLSNIYVLTAGILLGTLLLTVLELYIPHADPDHSLNKSQRLAPPSNGSRYSLLLMAMVLHNLPEGLSTGVSLASKDTDLGWLVTLAIGLQNVPEGFLVALFLITQGTSRSLALLYSVLIASTEWLASVAGYLFASRLDFLIPYGLAFAGGAMLYVVYKELIPESHGDGNEIPATIAFIVGTITMIGLTTLLE
ncbi:ZIP family metal transporter [Paenibacillus sp. GCM10012307]|uniref:ZIP family metal transporter n=1 Tax=Paenibacillus roseus TaxID=2798579 RepID=A0A934J896_9BACL|nr:ZIP family metal transporter [Paenibacillus roseus]MBJ6363619.1 ZIP family metal transporter [Paenibacillus roseus]